MIWEYWAIDLNDTRRGVDDIDLLNKAGQNGWELVAITPLHKAVLKRPIIEAELADVGVSSKSNAIAVKYRNPETGETWSGRGRMANWLAEKVRAGLNPESFLVRS